MNRQVQDSSHKMNLNKEMTDTQRRILLSVMWIFVLLNVVYADILRMLRPGYLESLKRTSQELSGSSLLLFAVLMEIAISMVLISQLLNYQAIRWAHFIAVPLTILGVIAPLLMPTFGDGTPLFYIFFASLEVVMMLVIIWYVWKWFKPQSR